MRFIYQAEVARWNKMWTWNETKQSVDNIDFRILHSMNFCQSLLVKIYFLTLHVDESLWSYIKYRGTLITISMCPFQRAKQIYASRCYY